MTRETKVGLLIGTLILLLVGIVVSDHLAVKQEQDRLSSERFAGIQPPSVPGDGNLSDGVGGARAGDTSANRGGPSSVIPTIGDLGDRNLESLVPGFNQRNNASNTGNGTGNTNGNARVATNGNESVANNTTTNAADDRMNAIRNLLQNNNLLDNGNRADGPLMDDIIPPNSGNNNASNVRPVIHYVKPGETLWAIADQYYGDGNKWKIIKTHNKDKVPSDNQVREGVRLEIPNRVVEGGVATNGNTTNGGASTTTNNRTSAGRTVTVKSGDNLTRIAQVHLGSVKHVDLILKANRDKIRNADQIRVGMVLKMPAIPAQPAAVNNAANNDLSNHSAPDNRTRPPANNSGAPTHAAPANEVATTASPRKYVVQDGDTLSAVAAETLGNKNRWQEIWKLNKTRIPNPNVLSEGIALILPARER